MQTLDIQDPDMPDLQFVLLVTALCTSRLTLLNIPQALRTSIFNRCWVLIHDSPPAPESGGAGVRLATLDGGDRRGDGGDHPREPHRGRHLHAGVGPSTQPADTHQHPGSADPH